MVHMNDTLAYLNCRLPCNRKVSGYFVKCLTEVPTSTDFQVPRLVHALFKTHACCEEAECVDNVSRYVAQGDLEGCLANAAIWRCERKMSSLG